MRVWAISDTHGKHDLLKVPAADMVIFAGDGSNEKHPIGSIKECVKFFNWFSSLEIQHKVLVMGNHEVAVWKGLLPIREIEDMGINVLMHEPRVIAGFKFFGSPYTPTYGENWAYNVKRCRLHEYWQQIPDDCEILVTHGPPKYLADETNSQLNELMHVGCEALRKRILNLPSLRMAVFGHIHNWRYLTNSMAYFDNKKLMVNAAVTADNSKELQHSGFVVDILKNSFNLVVDPDPDEDIM